MSDKVKIINLRDHNIGFIVEDLKIQRIILPGKFISLDKEVFEECLNYIGIQKLISKGYLKIENFDDEVLVDIGAPEDTTVLYSFEELKELVSKGTEYQIRKVLKEINPSRYGDVVSAALAAPTITFTAAKIISEIIGADVIRQRKELENNK